MIVSTDTQLESIPDTLLDIFVAPDDLFNEFLANEFPAEPVIF